MADLKTFSEFLIEKGVYEKYWSYVSVNDVIGVEAEWLLFETFNWSKTDEGGDFWCGMNDQWEAFLKSNSKSGEVLQDLQVVKEMTDFKSERLPTIADVMLRLDLIEKKLDKLMYIGLSSKGECQ